MNSVDISPNGVAQPQEQLCRDPTTMLNYPNEWQKRYFDGYYKIDPIIKKIRQRLGAVHWKDVGFSTALPLSFFLKSTISPPLSST